MWVDTVRIIAEITGLNLQGKVGTQWRAYKEKETIILEVPEEPKSTYMTSQLVYEFGDLVEPLVEKGLAKRWQERLVPLCEDIRKGNEANYIW